jgi:hypothetical protein
VILLKLSLALLLNYCVSGMLWLCSKGVDAQKRLKGEYVKKQYCGACDEHYATKDGLCKFCARGGGQ